jgi:hypothetical protein
MSVNGKDYDRQRVMVNTRPFALALLLGKLLVERSKLRLGRAGARAV